MIGCMHALRGLVHDDSPDPEFHSGYGAQRTMREVIGNRGIEGVTAVVTRGT
jgi:hypothetical protein